MGVVQTTYWLPEMVPGTGQIFRRGETEGGETKESCGQGEDIIWPCAPCQPCVSCTGSACPGCEHQVHILPGSNFVLFNWGASVPKSMILSSLERCSSLRTCLSHPVPLMSASFSSLLQPHTCSRCSPAIAGGHFPRMSAGLQHLSQDEFWAPLLLARWAWPSLILLPSPSLQAALWRSSMGHASHFSCLCRGCFKRKSDAIPRHCRGVATFDLQVRRWRLHRQNPPPSSI